jgi:hypothetical protein
MITGGEITSKHIIFDVGTPEAVFSLQSMFASRANYFLVPPYNERIDMAANEKNTRFSRFDGADLHYEDARFILNKLILFQAISAERGKEFISTAQGLLPCTSTLLFPDPKRTILEFSQYENWARLDFNSEQFRDLAEKVLADMINFLPVTIEVKSNTNQEITLRTTSGERLFLSDAHIKKIAAVLVSFGLVPPELHLRFVLNAGQFSLKQATRIYLHHTLYTIEDSETVGGSVFATYASDQALRVLRQLGEHGAIEDLSDNDAVFLSHVTLFTPQEYKAFEGVVGLQEFIELFIAAYKTDILALSHLRLQESLGDGYSIIEKEGMEIIEGNTSRVIEKNEEYRSIMEHYQKKFGGC